MSLVEKALRKAKADAAPDSSRTPGGADAAPPTVVGAPQVDGPASAPHAAPEVAFGHGAPVLELPRARLRHVGLLPPQAIEANVAEQFRRLKRPLLAQLSQGDGPRNRALLVTSARPGDGKTFTSLNLAFSLARERDFSVLLVDGDVAKRDLSIVFGMPDTRGLMDFLASGDADIERYIVPTDQPNLSFLPAGSVTDAAPELLGGSQLKCSLDSLLSRRPHAIVLFDAGPVLMTSEARSLAGVVGHALLVVRAGSTERQAVTDAVEAIGGACAVSLVLNQAEIRADDGYGYYFSDRDARE